MRSYILFLVLLSLALTNCTTIRPIQDRIGEADYNGRQVVRDAQLQKKLNIAGLGMTATATAAGAFAGYQSDFLQFNNSEHMQETNKVGNAIIGGLVGFGLASLTNYLVHKQGQRTRLRTETDYAFWVNKFDLDFAYLEGNASSLKIIDKRIESRFQAKNFQDAVHFFRIFPESAYRDKVFQEALEVVSREEIPQLVDLHPNGKYADDARVKYFDTSRDLEQFKEAFRKYPKVPYDREEKAISLVGDFEEATWVLNNFPSTSQKKRIFIRSLATTYLPDQGNYMARLIGDALFLQQADLAGKSARVHRNFMSVLVEVEAPSGLGQLGQIYKDHQWVKFPERQQDFLLDSWEITYPEYTDGDALLSMYQSLPGKAEFRHLELDRRMINSFIFLRLQEEVENNIVVSDETIKTPNSDGNFDNWKSSFFYDALYVNEVGERRFLLHGMIRNLSKFTLPVRVEFKGDFIATVDAEIFNIKMSDISRFFGIPDSERQITLASKRTDFFIPEIRKGEKLPFAVLFDLGKGSLKQGINVIGMQTYYESSLGNIRYTTEILREKVNSIQLDRQRHWISLRDQSMPYASVKELFGNEYDPENYVIELPTSDDYREWYGADCGCRIVSSEPERNFWSGKIEYHTLEFENGSTQDYSYLSDGRLEVHDGFLSFGRTKFDTYFELINYVMDECRSTFCN